MTTRKQAGQAYIPKFIEAIKRAESEAEQHLIDLVQQAAEASHQNWAAGMTLLERRYPDRWARKDRHQVEVSESKSITITHTEVVKDYGPGQAQIVESTVPKKSRGGVRRISEPKTYRIGKFQEEKDEDA